jgi:hypothetical protein
MSAAPDEAPPASRVTVSPESFTFVRFEAATIATVTAEMSDLLGVDAPIHVIVDESTPLSKLWAAVDDDPSGTRITIHAESGALEDTQRFTHFGERNARESLGRMLLRARDRRRPDFADVPSDLDLTLPENAAWDAYCAGRLARAGLSVNEQRWRYNFRNRFGFDDAVDAAFDRVWSADDLSWEALTRLTARPVQGSG